VATATDSRQKVDPDKVVELKNAGTSAKDIAEQGLASDGQPVAVGTIYKILRGKGLGGGPRGSGSKGLNVSSDVQSLKDRWQKQIDTLQDQINAENKRHEEALAAIQDNHDKAKGAMKKLDDLVKSFGNGSA
jgi:hypothetical protein